MGISRVGWRNCKPSQLCFPGTCRPGGRRTWMCAVFRPSQDGESENARVIEFFRLCFQLRKGISLVTFFVPAKKVTRRRRKLCTCLNKNRLWIPAFAGMTSKEQDRWITAFAGMTRNSESLWTPAFAGMTRQGLIHPPQRDAIAPFQVTLGRHVD